MPNFKKPYNKEEVLKWYRSLVTNLKQEGIDLENRPADLMRVKAMVFKPNDDKDVGNHDGDFGDVMFAFMPKKFSEKNGSVTDYVAPIPPRGTREQQEQISTKLLATNAKFNAYMRAVYELKDGYEAMKSPEEIAHLEEEVNRLKNEENIANKEFMQYRNQVLEGYNKWMFGNQKAFNPDLPEDYVQIEELYASALEGRLHITYPNKDTEDRVKIYVAEDGNSTLVEDNSKEGPTPAQLVSTVLLEIRSGRENKVVDPGLRKCIDAYEKDHGKLCGEGPILEAFNLKKPATVPAPTMWSWVKRIISFNQVKDDFTRYEQYQAQKLDYDVKRVAHEQKNKAQYDEILSFMDEYKDELGFPKGIKNIVVVENNRHLSSVAEFLPHDPDPQKGVYDERFNVTEVKAEFLLRNQLCESPETINPDGSLNVEASNQYWERKGSIQAPASQAEAEKALRKMNAARDIYTREYDATKLSKEIKERNLSSELGERKVDIEKKKFAFKQAENMIFEMDTELDSDYSEKAFKAITNGIEKEDAKLLSQKEWAKSTFDQQMRKIGSLFTKSTNPSDKFRAGILMTSICVSRNRSAYQDGSDKDFSKLKTDSGIIADLTKLLDMAEHPEKVEVNKELVAELEDVLKTSKEEPNSLQVADSLASIISSLAMDNHYVISQYQKLDNVTAFCCGFAFKCMSAVKNPEDYFVDDVSFEKGQMPLSSGKNREMVFEAGRDIITAREVMPKLMKAQKAYTNFLSNKGNIFKKEKERVLEESETSKLKDIDPKNLKRERELGL